MKRQMKAQNDFVRRATENDKFILQNVCIFA